MLKPKLNLSFLILLSIAISCSPKAKNKKVNHRAVVLTKQATDIYSNTIFQPINKKKDSLLIADSLLNEAIQIDSNYVWAYLHKVHILVDLKRYKTAIKIINKITKLKKNYAEVITFQGFLYEKIGLPDSANTKYNEAIQAYRNRIKNGKFIINSKSSIAFLLAFTKDKDSALKKINALSKEYPKNDQVAEIKKIIDNFNRKKLIDTMLPTPITK